MKMNYDLLSEKVKIKGKIIETSDDTMEQFVDRNCVFNSPQLKDPLYMVVGNENIFLGNIKTITQILEKDEEICYVETNMGSYKFKILNKSPNKITNNKEIIQHLSELLHKSCDDVIDNFVADIFVQEDFDSKDKGKESVNSQKHTFFPWQMNENQKNNRAEEKEIPSFLRKNK